MPAVTISGKSVPLDESSLASTLPTEELPQT